MKCRHEFKFAEIRMIGKDLYGIFYCHKCLEIKLVAISLPIQYQQQQPQMALSQSDLEYLKAIAARKK